MTLLSTADFLDGFLCALTQKTDRGCRPRSGGPQCAV
jgi:hypothetical protein